MDVELRRIMPGDTAEEVVDIIYDNDADVLNTVDELKTQLYGGNEETPEVACEEVIPFGAAYNLPTNKDLPISYEVQDAIQGKHIHSIRAYFASVGLFTVFMATDRQAQNVTWQHTYSIAATGEQEIIIDQDLPAGQLLIFIKNTDSAMFMVRNGAANLVAGGMWRGGVISPINLAVGIRITPEPGEQMEVDGDIPQLWAEINALKNGVTDSAIDYIALGDSITYGFSSPNPYPVYLGNRPGITLLNNFAVSGKKVIGNDGLITEINQVPNYFSGLITVMIGVNDSNTQAALGNTTTVLGKSYADLDVTASFAEAFRYCLETLLNKAPTAKILVILPLYAGTGQAKDRIELYRQVERDICAYFAIPYADIYKTCGISPLTYSTFTSDGIHPNTAGYIRIERALWPVVRDLMTT